jgi:HD-like signal output (HDOD) protein
MPRSDENKPSMSYRGGNNPNISFPPLPQTVAEVSALLAETEAEPDTLKLAEIVDSDPVVAAAVLRRINSAYYGMRRRIGNVRKAVMLLGFLEVANIVLTAGMIKLEEVFSKNGHTEIFEKIMEMSVGVGQCGRETAGFLDLPVEGRSYTAGLLHAVGRLVFLYNHPDQYQTLWERDGALRPPSREAEADMFGVDHTVVGAQAADNWKLPHFIIDAIRHYPAPDEIDDADHRQLAQILAVGVSVVDQYGCESDQIDASDVDYEAPPQLADLVQSVEDVTPEELIDYLVEKQEQIRGYVDTMTHHH